ncbi:MAG: phosphate starvation-inducible protein PhoH [Deltaproteobacteria bacterium]|nr:phosphate starvation-inducible protein PhoH [Deltaproteobacteria bacterium]
MIKNFVLDTNVLLHDPNALFKFEDNRVFVPIVVIEELDHFKKDLNMLGRNARTVSKYIDRLREKGNLSDGVPLENGGMLRVAFGAEGVNLLPSELRGDLADNHILGVAMSVRGQEKDVPVVVITKDTNLRIKADALGIHAEDFESDRVDIDELYRGVREVPVGKDFIDRFYAAGECDPPPGAEELFPNEYVVFRDASTGSSALARHDFASKRIRLLPAMKEDVWGIRPRNKEQHFALDILLDDSVKLVTLAGKAGTGKTLLAIAAGLRKTSDDEVYQRMLVSRPVLPMGKDLGFLPGDVEEKLKPWMQPIFDNVEYLFGFNKKKKQGGVRGYQELMNLGILEIEPLTYIRGRSIPNQFIIVDEAQNLSPHEVKTILTRAGENSKVVLTGDPYQIDNPFVDSASNGLSHAVEKFKGESMAGHVLLVKGERSPLAELAANIL